MCFRIKLKDEMNKLTELANNQGRLVKELTNQVIRQKWPKEEDEIGIFRFLFECNTFLRVFVLIGTQITCFFSSHFFESFFLLISY